MIDVLEDERAIRTVIPGNTRYGVAAGGFQGVTDPSYVLKIEDSGPVAASAADIFVLDNALGYVLNRAERLNSVFASTLRTPLCLVSTTPS